MEFSDDEGATWHLLTARTFVKPFHGNIVTLRALSAPRGKSVLKKKEEEEEEEEEKKALKRHPDHVAPVQHVRVVTEPCGGFNRG